MGLAAIRISSPRERTSGGDSGETWRSEPPISSILSSSFSTLAKRLRLRAPTVIHHLNTLRLAGLVVLSFEKKGDKRYAARLNRVSEMSDQLMEFLTLESEE